MAQPQEGRHGRQPGSPGPAHGSRRRQNPRLRWWTALRGSNVTSVSRTNQNRGSESNSDKGWGRSGATTSTRETGHRFGQSPSREFAGIRQGQTSSRVQASADFVSNAGKAVGDFEKALLVEAEERAGDKIGQRILAVLDDAKKLREWHRDEPRWRGKTTKTKWNTRRRRLLRMTTTHVDRNAPRVRRYAPREPPRCEAGARGEQERAKKRA